jgi:hypothetical protein
MTCTACLVCFISTVNDRNKKKKTFTSGASSGHITKLKQSIILRCLWLFRCVGILLEKKSGILVFSGLAPSSQTIGQQSQQEKFE